jgi:hypothetical protein
MIRPALRVQLLRDQSFLEEDELREVVENLCNLVESYRAINVDDSDDSSHSSDELDY